MFGKAKRLAGLGILLASGAFASTPDQPLPLIPGQVEGNEQWLINGGEFKIRLNRDLLAMKGIGFTGFKPAADQDVEDEDFAVYPLVPKEGLQFNAPEGRFDRFTSGKLGLNGGFSIALPSGEKLRFKQAELRYSHDNPMRLELVSDDGRAWLYLNHLMYKMVQDYTGFYLRSADLRASAALAGKIGHPELADAYIGEVKMRVNVVQQPYGFKKPDAKAILACPDFHGTPAPGGGFFQADVLMEFYTMSGTRCRNSTATGPCDGFGADDGDVVFTPSSTLRNSNNANTADVPWYQKFTVSSFSYPYSGNDQHPFLIWNMYRVVDDQLEQIGASGVKHAFVSTNTGCAAGACTAGGGHILGKNCGDTYGTGNNDSSSSLGPRSELIPALGRWARCNSIYDDGLPVTAGNVACDGIQDSSGNDSYMQRMVVKESKLYSGTQIYSESWYVVQDDVNIYNTMAHRTFSPASAAEGAYTLGPVINTWVDPVANPTRNVEIAVPEGRVRIAVKTKELATCPAASGLSGTCYRYDYVVNNFDFARVQYMPPPNNQGVNLGITSSKGFSRFRLGLGSTSSVWLDPAMHFADIDLNTGNDWTFSTDATSVTWTAPAGNDLNWGKLYRFSLITTAAPDAAHSANASLDIEPNATLQEFSAAIMVPNAVGLDVLFLNDFE